MSRTYRTHLDWRYCVHGVFYNERDESGLPWRETVGWLGHHFINRNAYDRKPWYKPCKFFKKMRRQAEKAKVKNAIRTGKEIIPFFKKSDQWNWT